MKIQYKKKRLIINLIAGIIWILIGIVSLLIFENNTWISYGYLLLAILYLGMYFYENTHQYLTIKEGIISQNVPFSSKKIALDDIKTVKKFAGDYILKTDNEKLTINTEIIAPKSLEELIKVLEKLPAEKK